jgi:hypothetical protein
VRARDGDHEARVGLDQAHAGLDVALLDAAGECDLLGGRKERRAPQAGQEQREPAGRQPPVGARGRDGPL